VEYNKNGIVVRGWFPLTQNLLIHAEIAISAEGEAQEVPSLSDGQSTEAIFKISKAMQECKTSIMA
jgi:hypothetical protein